jgi:hypothetical protein
MDCSIHNQNREVHGVEGSETRDHIQQIIGFLNPAPERK